MNQIFAVATNTFREAVRDKVLHSILFFAVLLLLVSLAMQEITIGDQAKVVRGVALGGISLMGGLIAIFLGVGLVWKEIEKKTIYTLASKPLARSRLLLGKYLGLWLTLAAEVGILTALYTVIVGSQQGMPSAGVYLAVAMLMLELTLLTAWATLFSTFAAPTTASAYSLCIYLIGHFTDDLRRFGERSEDPTFKALCEGLYRVLPNLEVFNIRTEAVHGVAVPAAELGWAVAYGCGYTAVVLAVAMVVFERRDFK
ncbi:MAG: ABC transporter permease [Pseudomonadota bacterium]|nr:ABC transporter permease [Pseudomonadota bacterium]